MFVIGSKDRLFLSYRKVYKIRVFLKFTLDERMYLYYNAIIRGDNVMKIHRAYKFRLYPTSDQVALIHKTFGCTRFVYNYCLDLKRNNKYLTKFDLIKELPKLKKEYPFLKEVDSMSLQNAIADLMVGFSKQENNHGGYPKFKKKGVKESFRASFITSSYKGTIYENIKVDLKRRVIELPKLKEVKIRGYRNLEKLPGRILNATIREVGTKFYVFVCVEEEIELPERRNNQAVGIDIGVKNLVVTSNKEYYGNPRYLDKYERKIKGLQLGLSRKVKGSRNYIKNKKKIEEVYRKLKNARKKTVVEIIKKVITYYDIIIAENLQVKKMLEKKNNHKHLRKEITNATFSEIIRILKYKCNWLNKTFIQVNSYYPSSQICSRCGNKNEEMKDLEVRELKCSKCGLEIERDYNASINILNEGVEKLQ